MTYKQSFCLVKSCTKVTFSSKDKKVKQHMCCYSMYSTPKTSPETALIWAFGLRTMPSLFIILPPDIHSLLQSSIDTIPSCMVVGGIPVPGVCRCMLVNFGKGSRLPWLFTVPLCVYCRCLSSTLLEFSVEEKHWLLHSSDIYALNTDHNPLLGVLLDQLWCICCSSCPWYVLMWSPI